MNSEIRPVHRSQWKPWILQTHYAHRVPGAVQHAFGLFENNELVGVVTYGTPASYTLCRGVCGSEYSKKVIELSRLVITTDAENAASFLVGRSLRQLPKPSIVVSYADKNQGHVGYIYQACNFFYTGLGSLNEPEWILPDGTSFTTRRHIDEKVKRAGFTMDQVTKKKRKPKHRYVFFVGNKRQKNELLGALNYPVTPYPKGKTERYECSPPIIKKVGFGF